MSKRSLQQVIVSVATSDGGGVKLLRSLGQQQTLRWDPFLMLDEFSSTNAEDYIAGFPDHPHRGFETVTYMLDGHMLHRDHLGHQGHLSSGSAQWMTAGRGIIHSEMPQQDSGRMRGFQLWINLPAKDKMQPAAYQDIAPEQIPLIQLSQGGQLKIIAGRVIVDDQQLAGPIQAQSTEVLFLDVRLPAATQLTLPLKQTDNALVYPYEGQLVIASETESGLLETHQAGLLSAGDSLTLQAGSEDSAFLLLAGKPLREPVVQHGPFVMNSREEIEQAIADYRNGRFV